MPKFNATYTAAEASDFIASHLKNDMFGGSGVNDIKVSIVPDPVLPVNGYNPIDMKAPVPQTVLREIVAGNLIGAIKEYRTLTGTGLKEAKDYVEHIKYDILNLSR